MPVAYAHDALVSDQSATYTASERAPPVEFASSAGHWAADHGSYGASTRPDVVGTYRCTTYDVPTSPAHIDNSTGTTTEAAEVIVGDLSVREPAG